MAGETRKYKLNWQDILNLQQMLRASATVAGAIPRQDVLKRLRNLTPEKAEEGKPVTEVVRELGFNREELGAMKLMFIELWSHQGTTGDMRDVIETAATKLDMWRLHVLKNLPKEPSVAIDTFDSDEDIMKGDSGEGQVDEEPPTAPAGEQDSPEV